MLNGELVQEQFPEPRLEAPSECPDVVGENYREALSAFSKGLHKSAVIMARSALQAATRERGATGKNLKAEMADLALRGLITKDLGEWAEEVRLGGNLIAHPAPNAVLTREEASEIIEFADALFRYLYVLPAQVAARRSQSMIAP
jgi:hypothetical protein